MGSLLEEEDSMTDQPDGPAAVGGEDVSWWPPRRRLFAAAVAACLAAGLAGGVLASTGSGPAAPPPATVPPPRPVVPAGRPLVRLTGALTSFSGCRDYLDYVRTRAEGMVGPAGFPPYGGPVDGYGFASRGAAMGAASMAAPSMAAAGGAPAASSGAAVAPSPGPAYSQTNDQVAGVDEPDTVKTDGHIVVTLEGATLRVLDSNAHVLGSIQLSGDTGGGLLLSGDRAVVLSSYADPGSGTTGVAQPMYGPAYGPGPRTSTTAQVTVVDLSDPASPQLVHSFLLDGSVVAARMVGGQVRLVLRRDGPNLVFPDQSSLGDPNAATAANKRLLAASTLADWLPAWQMENPDGSRTARQPLTACDSVARPDQASGISTVTIVSLDPQSDAPGPGASVVAAGQTVYATADHIYVAGPDSSGVKSGAFPEQQGCCSIAPPAGASTRIYEFAVPATGPATFVGAGDVPGWLVNSYAMDEDAAGRLRVASTSVSGTAPVTGPVPPVIGSQSQITVLEPSGGSLVTVGSVGGLGIGEYLKTVRFLGDQAYVVTFRSYDPLYVVDLSDPARPFLAGELDQPGFSEFLYPLPGHRLLGVGVELTQDNEPSGLVVATYDVGDPAHPSRIASSELAQGAQYAYGGYDPHAFLYWAPANLALLASPQGWGAYGPGAGVAAYRVGPGGSLSRAATLGHGSVGASRSVVIGSQVWVVTAGGVITSDLSNLPAVAWHPY